ncbi:MAG TPA: phenylacetate--CoA ligase family protein [Planctomycetota bacterium]|nr:phenylacetate--CoA ligase family protein [Phycisphaerae bacterium]HUW30467.1 phenylacetate--CoA ligase family protein [Planctomycetota bacterium]
MLPVVARTVFRIHERMLGRRTFPILRELRESQWWDRETRDTLRLERLKQTVRSAYEKTRYWRFVMDQHGIKPSDVRSLADVGRFPLLEKSSVCEHRDEMVWREESRRVVLARTSGSTNDALQYYSSSSREAHITAARMRGHEWVGIRPGEKELYFWAAPVEVTAQTRMKNLRDVLINNTFSNAVEMHEDDVPRCFASWEKWRPRCLFGYASSISLFARMGTRLGIDLRSLKARGLRAIVTTAEMLSEDDRRMISDAFGVPVCDSYGTRETALIGHECQHLTMHTNDEQLILETVNPQTGEPVDGEGELVVTTLANDVMPMIRYRTNDIVTLSDDECPCGRKLRSLRVTGGRLHEFIVTTEGKWVSSVAFLYICRNTPGIRQMQVRQDRLGEIRILVVPEENRPNDLVPKILKAARQRLGDEEEIKVELVDEIEPLASNKYRVVVSKVAEELMSQPTRRTPRPLDGS